MPSCPAVRILGRIVYWLAVLVISIALLVALVLFFESRDESRVEETHAGATMPLRGHSGPAGPAVILRS